MKITRNNANARTANSIGRYVMLVALRGQWLVKGLKHPLAEQEKKTE